MPSKSIKKFFWLSNILLILNILIYFILRVKHSFFSVLPHGDETKYFTDLQKAIDQSMYAAILDGTSITFLIFSKLVNYFTDDPLLAIRLTSFISALLILGVVYIFNKTYLKLKPWVFTPIFIYIIYLFLIQSYWLVGINDLLLALFGICLLALLFYRQNLTASYLLIGIFWAFAILTRKMAVTYMVVFFPLLIIYSLTKTNFFGFKRIFLIIFSFSITFLSIQFFSLKDKGNLSFDDKILKGPITWAQWDYHNALLIDQGKQARFQHVHQEETVKYIKEHGEDSLPKTFSEMVFFNLSLTLKEFFIDLYYSMKYMLRELGLLVIFFIIFLLKHLKKSIKDKSYSEESLLYFFSAGYFLFICFIVITNIQTRWFMFFLPITILMIGKDLTLLLKDKDKLQLFFILNNVFLIVMNMPYLLNKL